MTPDPPIPDPRLLQANERTLLAWIRTGVALLTFGFVIARIDIWLRTLGVSEGGPGVRPVGTAWVGAAFVAVGVLANGTATLRYLRTRRAILSGKPIPGAVAPTLLAAGVTVLGAVMSIYVLGRLL